ncbi:hypothetical protein PPERSA_08197 [Pseudocohnilembus persalinus]|uniref:AB hydrolase-1 domain-containing protein n=1 Tax=Pseudocohnilembus persalinus TaxID=266149 RepID=A0A0V0R3B0_PSEPJ|nr:hypothetical protein PPERSA_08197 [Pseudocohnilembus persalinus]|eukprot:KRX08994.1 hypothetical protein PPERSA_08197 [Pseudocohnilembus persalinus]
MCPSIEAKTFKPAPFFPNCLLQTMAASLVVQPNKNIQFKEESVLYLNTNEDSGLRLYWPRFENTQVEFIRNDVLILVIPGMTGTVNDVYINKLVEYITLVYQYKSVVYHYRFVADHFPKTEKPFDLTQDLEHTLEFIQKNYPEYKHIYAIGHSYGANFMVNYLGKSKENSKIKGAVSVANPYCLVTSFRLMKGKFYDWVIVFLFSSLLKNKRRIFKNMIQQNKLDIDLEGSIQATNTHDIIKRFNRKFLGYKTVGEYQRKHSSVRKIHKVKVPLLGLSSEDDQISHKRGIPKEEFELNPNCMLMVTKSGGHVGYVEATNLFNYRIWYFQPCLEYIQALIDIEKI